MLRGLRLGLAVAATIVGMWAMTEVAVAAPITSVALNSTQNDPVVGESVTYTATPNGGSSPYTYQWRVDDVLQDATSSMFTTAFSTTGNHAVTVNVSDSTPSDCTDPSANCGNTAFLTVNPALSGSVASSNESPTVGQSVQLTATASGGKAPLSISWNLDGNGFGEATGSTAGTSFSTPGSHTIQAQISDAANPAHTLVVSHTVNVQPAPPPPPPCQKQVDFGIVEITTAGCFTNVGTTAAPHWQTTSATNINGIPLPAPPSGTSFNAIAPTTAHPGGQIQLSTAKIQLGSLTVFDGAINWDLPAGKQGDEKTVASLKVPAQQTFKGLKVGGSIALHLGWDAKGVHYASFPLNIDLPNIFKTGPSNTSGGVSATGAIRVDLAGVHYDGLKLQVSNVWVGRLKVQSVCFSFVPAGGQAVTPCAPLQLGGEPFLTCNSNVNTDRWDGNAVLILPTTSQTKLGFFGGVANDQLSSLGGFVDNLGTTVPIVEGVYLNRVGVGLCVYPPPFKLKGTVGIAVLPTPKGATVGVNGYFLYTDPFGSAPWSLELGGDVSVFNDKLGSGKVIIRPTGSIDFDLQAGFGIAGVVTINGHVVGWIETSKHRFNIDGTVRACMRSLCATAEGVVSSTGLAGCLGLGSITWWTLERNSNWKWYAPWRVHWVTHVTQLKAGFGHRWADSGVQLFAGSCDLGSYSASRSQAGGVGSFVIKRGTPATAIRIGGQGAPPKIVVTGPNGVQITSPAGGGSAQQPGQWDLVENTSDNSTSILLIKPPAGTWHVTQAPGSTTAITSLAVAPYEAPPAITASVQPRGHGRETVALAYALPPGATLSINERGNGEEHPLAAPVHGHACAGPNRPGGEALRCAQITFTPHPGPGGSRQIVATVDRGGVPILQKAVATFRAAAQPLPSLARKLRISRRGTSVTIAWKLPRGDDDSFQTLSVQLGSGQQFGLQPGRRCTSARLVGVPANVSVSAQITGVRSDETSGRTAGLTLPAGRARAGARGTAPRSTCSSSVVP